MLALGPRVDGGSFLRPAGLLGCLGCVRRHGGPFAPTRGYDFGFRSDSLPSGGSGGVPLLARGAVAVLRTRVEGF
jgi:hypothetical protein